MNHVPITISSHPRFQLKVTVIEAADYIIRKSSDRISDDITYKRQLIEHKGP